MPAKHKKKKKRRNRSQALIIKERNQRRAAAFDRALGYRIDEFVALTGTSRPTVWRWGRKGVVNIIYVDDMPFIPRSEAVRLGFINA